MTFNARIESAWLGRYFSWGSGRVAAYVGADYSGRLCSSANQPMKTKNKYSVLNVCPQCQSLPDGLLNVCPQCQTVVTKTSGSMDSMPETSSPQSSHVIYFSVHPCLSIKRTTYRPQEDHPGWWVGSSQEEQVRDSPQELL